MYRLWLKYQDIFYESIYFIDSFSKKHRSFDYTKCWPRICYRYGGQFNDAWIRISSGYKTYSCLWKCLRHRWCRILFRFCYRYVIFNSIIISFYASFICIILWRQKKYFTSAGDRTLVARVDEHSYRASYLNTDAIAKVLSNYSTYIFHQI